MQAANKAAGTGGYQSDFSQDAGFMGGSWYSSRIWVVFNGKDSTDINKTCTTI